MVLILWLFIISQSKDALFLPFSLMALGVGSLMLCNIIWINKNKVNKKMVFAYLIYLLLGGINIIEIGSLSIGQYLIDLLIAFPIGINLYIRKNYNDVVWDVNFFILFVYLIYSFVTNPVPEHLFEGLSQNYISILLITYLFILSVVHQKNNTKIPIIIIIAFYFACIIAVGRMGIICGTIYIAYQYYYRSFYNDGRWAITHKSIIRTIILFVVLVLLAVNLSYVLDHFFNRFISSHRLWSDTVRTDMFKQYIESIFGPGQVKNLLIGIDTTTISPLYEYYNGNPHNSVFLLHSKLGIFPIVYLLFALFCFIYKAKKNKNYEIIAISIVALFRGLSDSMYGGLFYDFILVYISLYSLLKEETL